MTAPAVAPVLASLRAGDDVPSPAPTTPVPSAPAPTTPAPASSSSAGEHTVPEKVQTGDSAVVWLAGVAALGAAGLVVFRRRRGLAR